jgi:hypothetical protein
MPRLVSSIAALRKSAGTVSVRAGHPEYPALLGRGDQNRVEERPLPPASSSNCGHHVDDFSSHFEGVYVFAILHRHQHGTANGERDVLFRDHRIVAFDNSRTGFSLHLVHRPASARIECDGRHDSLVRGEGP